MNDYILEAARTDAPVGQFFFTKTAPADAMQKSLVALMDAAQNVDLIKKGLFYDRKSDRLTQFLYENHDPALMEEYDVDADYVHAILGIITEAGELAEILWKHQLIGDDIEISRHKILDESGDLLWYLAKLFRKLGVSFEDVGDLNIRKLAKRFPDKFSTALANHRNEAQESTVFQ